MKVSSNLGHLLLAIYLILVGVIGAFGVNLGQFGIVVPVLALAAGILMILGR
jgi:hypothetical protein|uniref:hypothetical protein n=1 Tax=Prosthecobacter sp. TaxID=1965333 RepID=UPI0037845580